MKVNFTYAVDVARTDKYFMNMDGLEVLYEIFDQLAQGKSLEEVVLVAPDGLTMIPEEMVILMSVAWNDLWNKVQSGGDNVDEA